MVDKVKAAGPARIRALNCKAVLGYIRKNGPISRSGLIPALGLSAAAVALLLKWNRHGLKSSGSRQEVRATNRLIALLRKEFPGKFLIHHDLVSTQLNEDDRAWMEEQGGFSLDVSTDAHNDTGVRSDAELTTIAEAAVPHLRSMLKVQ